MFLEFALEAVWQAGRVTLGHYQTGVAAERKADNSPVTIADRQAEEKLRELITLYWPEHNIIGEEFPHKSSDSRFTWVIDPIDGTKSFVSGVPLYSTLLALLDGQEAVLGIAHFPALDDTVYALSGAGCFWNGRRARVSTVDRLQDAVLISSELNHFGARQGIWDELVSKTYAQRTWGDAYGYFLVATGRAEVMLDPAMHLWDIAPLGVIMAEAGGRLTDWSGEQTIYSGECVASNGRLHEPLMDIIHGQGHSK